MLPMVEGLMPLLNKSSTSGEGKDRSQLLDGGRGKLRSRQVLTRYSGLSPTRTLTPLPSASPAPLHGPAHLFAPLSPHLCFNWPEPIFPSFPQIFLTSAICYLSPWLLLALRAHAFFCFRSFNCHLTRVSRMSRLKGLCLIYRELPLCWFYRQGLFMACNIGFLDRAAMQLFL